MSDEAKDVLTEEDKRFIIDNYNKMSPYRMALERNIQTEGTKCQIINRFIEEANLKPGAPSPITVDVKKEEPKIDDVVKDIIDKKDIEDAPVDTEKPYENITTEQFATVLRNLNIFIRNPMSEKEKKEILFLMKQMEATRYLFNYRSYRKKEYKQLFQEEFIRMMWTKGEMPQEEVNDFIDVCNETVHQYDIKCKVRELEKTRELLNNIKDWEKRTTIDTMVIELNKTYADSTKRTTEIKKSLGTNREQRLKDSKPTGLTVASLIDGCHNIEKKEALIKLQNQKDKELKEAIKTIDELDETKALIMGIGLDDLINGSL